MYCFFSRFVFFLFFSFPLLADTLNYVEIGAIALSQKSNTEPMLFHADRSLSTLDGSPIVQKEVDPYLSFQYITQRDTQKITTILNEDNRLSLRVEGKTVGGEVFVRPSYEFKNPYQLTTARVSTLALETGASGIYKKSLANNDSVEWSYTVAHKKVFDDLLAQQLPSLQRDGYIHTLNFTWTNPFFKLTTGAFTTLHTMGEGENHQGLHFKLSSAYTINQFQIVASTGFTHTQYNGVNPFFGTSHRNNSFKGGISCEYDFSPKGYYLITGVTTHQTFSTLSFFDVSSNALFVGMGKNF